MALLSFTMDYVIEKCQEGRGNNPCLLDYYFVNFKKF